MWIGGPTSISTSFGILRPYLPENRAIMPSGMKALYCSQFERVILVPARMVPSVLCELLSIFKGLKSIARSLLLPEISFGPGVLGFTCAVGEAPTMPRIALTALSARNAIGTGDSLLGLLAVPGASALALVAMRPSCALVTADAKATVLPRCDCC